jgi:hypothetical protein
MDDEPDSFMHGATFFLFLSSPDQLGRLAPVRLVTLLFCVGIRTEFLRLLVAGNVDRFKSLGAKGGLILPESTPNSKTFSVAS